MDRFDALLDLLARLEAHHIYYRLNKVSEMHDSIMVEVAIPGERWEIEVHANGQTYIEKFMSDGVVYDENALQDLFSEE